MDSVLAEHELDYETAVNRLPYTTAAIKESLRLQPSVPVDFKTAVEDTVLPHGKVRVPKGMIVMYMPYVMGRMPSIWGEGAATWRPERWLAPGFRPTAYEYPVFNVGAAACFRMWGVLILMLLRRRCVCVWLLCGCFPFTGWSAYVPWSEHGAVGSYHRHCDSV